MHSLLGMGNPYPHAPEVSIVRIDTCTIPCSRLPERLSNSFFVRFSPGSSLPLTIGLSFRDNRDHLGYPSVFIYV